MNGATRVGRHRCGFVILTAAALCLPLVACGSSRAVNTAAAPASSATTPAIATASPTPSPSEDPTSPILAAYREFFDRQAEISAAPATERRAMLAPFTVNPELDRVLQGMFAAEGFGEVAFGTPTLHPNIVKMDADTATINDCQDTSRVGQKKRDTGKVTEVGFAHDNARTTMRRGTDGRWRVSTVSYESAPC